jgi:L-fuculose-phosphate aldolase
MRSVDLRGEKVISRRDVLRALAVGANELVVDPQAVLTITAQDELRRHGCALRRQDGDADACPAAGTASANLFGSPEAEAAANEIAAVGRKLWQRQYVDGNGGNISCRVGGGLVLCTPTLVSKGDLRPEDLCLVDLGGKQIAGTRACTSEILMHLAIYRAVPEAKAIVHSHPPHATAYAITGRIPANRVIPEYEVFVGQVALARYETPGTRAFAESVLPHVRSHNTVLLANHGVVCWADSVTRAEWCTEIVDTYCWMLTLASQMRAPLTRIPRAKAVELLEARVDGGGAKRTARWRAARKKAAPRRAGKKTTSGRSAPRKSARKDPAAAGKRAGVRRRMATKAGRRSRR